MKMKMMISEASGYFFFFSPLTVTLSLISAHDNKNNQRRRLLPVTSSRHSPPIRIIAKLQTRVEVHC